MGSHTITFQDNRRLSPNGLFVSVTSPERLDIEEVERALEREGEGEHLFMSCVWIQCWRGWCSARYVNVVQERACGFPSVGERGEGLPAVCDVGIISPLLRLSPLAPLPFTFFFLAVLARSKTGPSHNVPKEVPPKVLRSFLVCPPID